jgi:monoamine oxidase
VPPADKHRTVPPLAGNDSPPYPFPAAIASAGRLFFAGEHCSTDQAWIQGSLISSLRNVLWILTSP